MEAYDARNKEIAEKTVTITDAIDGALEDVQNGAAVGVTTVSIDGKTLTLDQAIESLKQKVAADAPEFDVTQPRVVEPVAIQFGSQVKHLRLPFWALRKFQKATNVSPWDHRKVWGWPPDMDLVIHLVWAGLLDENPDITVEEVERLEGMDFANIHYIRSRLDECWGRNADSPEAPAEGSGDAVPNQ